MEFREGDDPGDRRAVDTENTAYPMQQIERAKCPNCGEVTGNCLGSHVKQVGPSTFIRIRHYQCESGCYSIHSLRPFTFKVQVI